MLMMSRREGEVILIGADIEIVIAHIGRTRVKVGIRAPRDLVVVAKEVQLVGEENRAAAQAPSPVLLETILARLHPTAQTFSSPTDEGSIRQEAGTKN